MELTKISQYVSKLGNFQLKNLRNFIVILLTLIMWQPLAAQYTLQDADVRIKNGIIDSCLYNFEQTDIIIPEVLQGQTVIEIADGKSFTKGIFGYKGITSLKLPSTLEYIGYYAFRDNALTHVDFSNCTNLEQIVNEAFCRNTISSIDFTGCENLLYIGNNAFRVNELTTIDFAGCKSLSIISVNAFTENSLSSIDLSACKSLKFLNFAAFSGNAGLNGFALPVTELPGFTLLNWLCSNGDVFAGGATVSSTSFSYTAQLFKTTYSITYNLDGGTHSNALEYTIDDTPLPLNPAVKEGYRFLGWYNNAEFAGDPFTFISNETASDLEFWALFAKAYTITYHADGGTHNNPADYITANSPITLTAAAKTGYEFLGWYDNAEFTGTPITEIAAGSSSNMELWAKFTVIISVSENDWNQISVYPNPVTENVVVNHENIDVERINVLNAVGQILFSVAKPSSKQTIINLANYNPGLYYISVLGSNGTNTVKKVLRTN